ncbi:MAG: CarD family transcriptional regulator, partial [Gammaproteobacteria bacterium]
MDELAFYGDGPEVVPLSLFPGWETLPYDTFSPYQDIVSDRLATLMRLPRLTRGIVVTTVATAMHRLLPSSYLERQSLLLQKGQKLAVDPFRRRLAESGYRYVSQVGEHGDAAVRGSILDLFPMGAERPYRIDLFDEVVDTIRTFDPDSQRSLDQVESVSVLPAREVALSDEGIARFRAKWRARFPGNPNACPVYREVSSGFAPPGIEYYLPLFYDSTQSLFDYFTNGCIVVFQDDATGAAGGYWNEVQHRYEQGRHDVERPLLPPSEIFFPPDAFLAAAGRQTGIDLSPLPGAGPGEHSVRFGTRVPAALPIDAHARDPLVVFRHFQSRFHGRVLIAAESPGRRETLLDLFAKHELRPASVTGWKEFLDSDQIFAITVAPLDTGVVLDEPEVAVISETQLFGDRAQQRRLRKRRQHDSEAVVRNLTELTSGAPVVHLEHGVGRFRGLTTLTVGDVPGEFIVLDYA